MATERRESAKKPSVAPIANFGAADANSLPEFVFGQLQIAHGEPGL
jgi:hypothetical protein